MPNIEYENVPEVGQWVQLKMSIGAVVTTFRGFYLGTFAPSWDKEKKRVPWYFLPQVQKLARGASCPWVLHEDQSMRVPLNGYSLINDMLLYTHEGEWGNNIRATSKYLPKGYRFQLFDCSIKYADGRNRVVVRAVYEGTDYFIRLDSIPFPIYTE